MSARGCMIPCWNCMSSAKCAKSRSVVRRGGDAAFSRVRSGDAARRPHPRDDDGGLETASPLAASPRVEWIQRFARTTRRRADGTTRNRPPRPEGGRGRSCRPVVPSSRRPVVLSSLAERRGGPPPSAAGGRRDDELRRRREIAPPPSSRRRAGVVVPPRLHARRRGRLWGKGRGDVKSVAALGRGAPVSGRNRRECIEPRPGRAATGRRRFARGLRWRRPVRWRRGRTRSARANAGRRGGSPCLRP